jgi:hypothetical protein
LRTVAVGEPSRTDKEKRRGAPVSMVDEAVRQLRWAVALEDQYLRIGLTAGCARPHRTGMLENLTFPEGGRRHRMRDLSRRARCRAGRRIRSIRRWCRRSPGPAGSALLGRLSVARPRRRGSTVGRASGRGHGLGLAVRSVLRITPAETRTTGGRCGQDEGDPAVRHGRREFVSDFGATECLTPRLRRVV